MAHRNLRTDFWAHFLLPPLLHSLGLSEILLLEETESHSPALLELGRTLHLIVSGQGKKGEYKKIGWRRRKIVALCTINLQSF